MFVVVGVSGGIAAYKTVQLVRLLVQAGHDVHVVPTDDAVRFVGLPTWESISRNPVTTSVHDDVPTVRHVALGQAAELVIVAPATANTLAKMAAGLADDLLGTTLLATTAPVAVAPAMHTEMWLHPATQANVQTLRDRGVEIIGPEDGPLTGGDVGPGRMTEPDDVFARALALVERPRDLAGVRVVVSAGGTREPIDPVRYLGNRSSGRQGVAVALAAADRGARVTLVAAHLDSGIGDPAVRHPLIDVVPAGTAAELGAAVTGASTDADVIVMAAAVADYRVADVSDRKLAKEDAAGPGLTLELVQNDDILAGLVDARRAGQTIVGFAAETPAEGEDLVERGIRKRRRKGVDLLAVNEVGWTTGFETADNTLVVIDAADAVVARASGSKREVADALWDAIVAARA
ncbi:bifunctional phosphopantothenoylcysteine decarboxylase/phosphopantothenate--cysteine ligase CoaBC [Microbacterium thalassium]|uniref:Coenzyme A biosynthesis bifunctional protein CoaBC n=1 Tax=Microbacterium thalassium TaxID=362649 RepID=A0A7X0KW94_9MICO|nr:bifunctional phosphopantothenoylcysteine decarboxylase/phosphopantothenate--cysteine ligase CoaBC [Microbacterium thalassium]MBB6393018.1 phosphopantothenoylcysteine decarboxylase/phosphopantothenate--cysteine ligase [Microbacterium thalassium]GLK22751.1 phosphopantothenoylcysteine decarboxylase [Microbacterium thalassium]